MNITDSRPPLVQSGSPSCRCGGAEGARRLRPGRPPADRRHRPPQRLRRGAAHADPRQGRGADAALALLVRPAEGRGAEPRRSVGRAGARPASATPATARGPLDARGEDGSAARRVRGARLPRGLGLEGLPGDGRGLRHRAAAGLRESDRLEPPIFTPSTKAEEGHDENISFERMAEIVGGERAAELRDAEPRALRARARPRRGARHHPGRHQVRVRGAATAALVWIDEALTPDSSRFWPQDGYAPGRAAAELRQAVRARLPGDPRLGQEAAGPCAAGGSGRPHAREVRRGVRPPDRRRSTGAGQGLRGDGDHRRDGGEAQTRWPPPSTRRCPARRPSKGASPREAAARVTGHGDGRQGHPVREARREFEKRFIARVLQHHRGNLSRPPRTCASTATPWARRSRSTSSSSYRCSRDRWRCSHWLDSVAEVRAAILGHVVSVAECLTGTQGATANGRRTAPEPWSPRRPTESITKRRQHA